MIADLICDTCTPRPISFIDSPWRQLSSCIRSRTLIVVYAIPQWLIVISAATTSFISSNTSVDCCVLYCKPPSTHLSSHTSSSHMLIADLLFWYLHLNYKPIFHTHQLFISIIWNDIALRPHVKLQLRNVSSLLRHFDELLQCGQSPTTTQYW